MSLFFSESRSVSGPSPDRPWPKRCAVTTYYLQYDIDDDIGDDGDDDWLRLQCKNHTSHLGRYGVSADHGSLRGYVPI